MGLPNLMKAKVSLKGWVVIPAALRRRYRLKPGTVVEFREEGEKLYLVPCKQDPVRTIQQAGRSRLLVSGFAGRPGSGDETLRSLASSLIALRF